MQRFTTMRLGVVSFLSCLALLLGAFTSTGTVSAHPVSAQHTHPQINVFEVAQSGGQCLDFRIEGEDFSANHHADLLVESDQGGDVSVDPDSVHVNGDGNFARDAEVCVSFNRFNNCGNFIDNPDFFCGFSLNPQEFCGNGFGFEPSQFCFPGTSFGEGFPGTGFGGFSPTTRCQPFPNNPNPFSGNPNSFPGNPNFPGNPTDHCRQNPSLFHEGSGFCSFQFSCGFQPVLVSRFCGFHFLPFCFRFGHHEVSLLLKAEDSRSGRGSNTVEITLGNFF
jgi:hypothetical protein